jgi:hypothetical protein
LCYVSVGGVGVMVVVIAQVRMKAMKVVVGNERVMVVLTVVMEWWM